MKQVILCEVEVRESGLIDARRLDHDKFTFKSMTQVRKFLKENYDRDGCLNELYGPYHKSISKGMERIKEQFGRKGSWTFCTKNKKGHSVYYTIKQLEWREYGEPRPKRRVGDTWTIKRYKTPIKLRWANHGLVFWTVELKNSEHPKIKKSGSISCSSNSGSVQKAINAAVYSLKRYL